MKLRGKLKEIQLSRQFWGDRDQWVMAVNGVEISTLEEQEVAGEGQPFVGLDVRHDDFTESNNRK